MTREELADEIKRKIDDERELQGEYYIGRRSAFEYVLSLLEEFEAEMQSDSKPCSECEKERKNYPWPRFCKWCGRALSQ